MSQVKIFQGTRLDDIELAINQFVGSNSLTITHLTHDALMDDFGTTRHTIVIIFIR